MGVGRSPGVSRQTPNGLCHLVSASSAEVHAVTPPVSQRCPVSVQTPEFPVKSSSFLPKCRSLSQRTVICAPTVSVLRLVSQRPANVDLPPARPRWCPLRARPRPLPLLLLLQAPLRGKARHPNNRRPQIHPQPRPVRVNLRPTLLPLPPPPPPRL